MRVAILVVGGILACAGCVAEPEPAPAVSEVTSRMVAADPSCQDYTARVNIDGTELGQTDKSVIVYVPPATSGPLPSDPWLWGPPIGFSFGALVFVDREHRFHEFHLRRFASRDGGLRDGGFRGGFRHGFEHAGMHGMHRG
jgi:hypothetical protein